MRVGVKTQVGREFERPRIHKMWGFPAVEDPEEPMMVEPRSGVTLNRWNPRI